MGNLIILDEKMLRYYTSYKNMEVGKDGNAISYCGFNYKDYLELSVAFATLSLHLGT